MKNHIFYFVRYPFASGGAHISNLISLDNNFAVKNPTYSKENFSNYLLEFYKKEMVKNVSLQDRHISGHYIIGAELWVEQLKNLDYNYKNSVHQGHALCFFAREKLIKALNRRYINITFHTEKSFELLKKREYELVQTKTFEHDVYASELRYFYNNLIHEIKDFSLLNVFNLEVEEIFVPDITNVIKQINKKFDLNIPIEQAQELHSLWYNKNF